MIKRVSNLTHDDQVVICVIIKVPAIALKDFGWTCVLNFLTNEVWPNLKEFIDFLRLANEPTNIVRSDIDRNLDAIRLRSFHFVKQRECGATIFVLIASIQTLLTVQISLYSKAISVCKRSFATKTKTTNCLITIVSRTTEIRSIKLHTIFVIHAGAVVTN